MSDWMSGPHKAQRTAPLEVAPDQEPVELTDPVDVIAWLRALPVGAVLLDHQDDAWQVCGADRFGGVAFVVAGHEGPYSAPSVARYAPFRVLWLPGGDA